MLRTEGIGVGRGNLLAESLFLLYHETCCNLRRILGLGLLV